MTDSGTALHFITDRGAVDEALRRAAAAARRDYVRAGVSMPVWRSGRLVWVEPAELEVYDAEHGLVVSHRVRAEDPRSR